MARTRNARKRRKAWEPDSDTPPRNYVTVQASARALVASGYIFRRERGDWIRQSLGGRFHALVRADGFQVHFDLTGARGMHFSPALPETLAEEARRILTYQ